MTVIPILETPRLKLRPHRREEFPELAAMWADPVVTRFIGGKPSTEQEPPIQGIPELGWELVPSRHGNGYASEALLAVTAWGDERFGGARTVCMIDKSNAASIRVAQKLGYGKPEEAVYKGEPLLLFSRTATPSRP